MVHLKGVLILGQCGKNNRQLYTNRGHFLRGLGGAAAFILPPLKMLNSEANL